MSAWAARWVGRRFDGGDAGGGLHCWGLVRRVYRDQLGIELPRYGELSAADLRAIATATTASVAAGPWRAVARGAEREFDVILMSGPVRMLQGVRNLPIHIGVMTDDGRVLHVERATGAVCVPLDHPSIRFRYWGSYRYAERC